MTLEEIEEACKNSTPIIPMDVIHARMEYPFRRVFYPLGFPVAISTNMEEVLDIAAEGWGAFTGIFDTPPIQVRIGVLEGSSAECPPAPVVRAQQHIFTFVADGENHGVIDMASGFCGIWLTRAAIASPSYVRHFVLDCAFVAPISTRYATGVHSGCVSRNGVGVLLCGDSGAGKSTLSYACAKAGWTYTTDDGSYLVHDQENLLAVGNCYQVRFRPPSSAFFPEIEGKEITRRAEVGKPSIELRPGTMSGIRTSQTANVKHLVLLNRREGINAPLRPYSRDIVRKFLRQGRFSPVERLPAHYAMIDKLLEMEPLELRYKDLDWAIEQLDTLANTGQP